MKKAKKILAVALSVMMVFTMSLPVFADTVDLNVATSADGIYAALQANMAAGSPVITTGIKGNITVNNLNDGSVLTAYKLLDITANGDGTIASVALNSAYSADVWGPLTISSVSDLSDKYQADPSYLSTFMNQLKAASPALTGGIDSSVATGDSVTFSNLDLGMYYIVQTNSGLIAGAHYTTIVPMLITIPFKNGGAWYSDVTATAKNSSTGVDKKIKAEEDSVFKDTADQYSNKIIDYRIEVDAPQWKATTGQVIDIDNVSFGIYDAFGGQEYVDSSMKVYALPAGVTISDTDTFTTVSAKPGVVDATSWFTVLNMGSGVTVEITPTSFHNMMVTNADGSQSAAYAKYVFFYATVFKYSPTLGPAGNPNNVEYRYSRGLDDVWDRASISDRCLAFTYGLNIAKYFMRSGVEYLLADAEFQLIDDDGNTIWFNHNDGTTYKYATTDATGLTYYDDEYYTNVVAGPTAFARDVFNNRLTTTLKTSGTTGSAKVTNLYIEGLDEGTFTIKEIKAPSGYSEINDFNITLTGIVDGTGNKTGELADITIDGVVIPGSTGILSISILDGTGLTLPSTGGTGIIIFTLTGMAILLGCEAGYLVRKSRRKYSEK